MAVSPLLGECSQTPKYLGGSELPNFHGVKSHEIPTETMCFVIFISKNMLETAKKEAEILTQNLGRNTANFSDNRDLLGSLGEQAFNSVLDILGLKENKDYIYPRTTKNQFGDKYDFLLIKNNKTIDVKTAYTHRDLLIKIDRFEKCPCDFYVLVNLHKNLDKAEVIGYATKEQAKKSKIKLIRTLDFVVPEKSLKDISFFKSFIINKNGRNNA